MMMPMLQRCFAPRLHLLEATFFVVVGKLMGAMMTALRRMGS